MHSGNPPLSLTSVLRYPSFIVGYRGIGQLRPVNKIIILSVESHRHLMSFLPMHYYQRQANIDPLQILSYPIDLL